MVCNLWGDRVDDSGIQQIGLVIALNLERGEAISSGELGKLCTGNREYLRTANAPSLRG